jgi:hypothetical protein
MKKLFALLCIIAGCWAVGNLQNGEQAAKPAPAEPAVYEITVPSPAEAGSRLAELADDLRAFFALFSVEKQPRTGENPQSGARYVITIQG